MPELTVSATAPLIIIGCIITIAVIIAIANFVSKGKYKQKVDAVAAKTKQLAAALDELFKPVKRTTREDVDHLLATNQKVIHDAKQLSETRSRTNGRSISSCTRPSVTIFQSSLLKQIRRMTEWCMHCMC